MSDNNLENGKKELTIDFRKYENELQNALQKGVQTGYTQALNHLIRYLKGDTRLADSAQGEVHQLWEYILKALGKEDEWEEYLELRKKQAEKEEDKEEQ